MKLYEITNIFAEFAYRLDQAETPEDLEACQVALQGIEYSFDEKIENIAKVVRNIEAESKAYKEEEQRLKAKKQSAEKKVEFLKQYMFDSMEFLGKEKVQAGVFTVSIRNNGPSVQVLDEASIPEEYFIEQEPKLDKTSIKNAIKQGKEVPGAELIRTRSLQIK